MVFGAEADERFDWTRFDVAPPCQATGFRNLTAAQIGGDVTGTLDAAGCNIGVYYAPGTTGSVSAADISGANYYGVVVNAAAVNVTNSSIHDIGETPLNGVSARRRRLLHDVEPEHDLDGSGSDRDGQRQHRHEVSEGRDRGEWPRRIGHDQRQHRDRRGPGALHRPERDPARARRDRNDHWQYRYRQRLHRFEQRLIHRHPRVRRRHLRPLTTGVSITGNTVTNNDMGVYVFNTDATGSKPPTTKTKNSIVNNTISNGQATNVSGNGSPDGYQAGIVGYGKGDNIVNNKISGIGYDSTQRRPARSTSRSTSTARTRTSTRTARSDVGSLSTPPDRPSKTTDAPERPAPAGLSVRETPPRPS